MRRRNQGFTLIELMVVMVVVGLLVSLAAFSPGSAQQRELENQARKLMATLEIASEEAVLQNQELGFFLDEKSYDIRTLDEDKGEWLPSMRSGFSQQALPSWLLVDFERDGKPIEFTSGDDESKPQMVMLSSGEMTPFRLTLTLPEVDGARYVLYSDGINGLVLDAPNDVP